jgi:hypothetical protein
VCVLGRRHVLLCPCCWPVVTCALDRGHVLSSVPSDGAVAVVLAAAVTGTLQRPVRGNGGAKDVAAASMMAGPQGQVGSGVVAVAVRVAAAAVGAHRISPDFTGNHNANRCVLSVGPQFVHRGRVLGGPSPFFDPSSRPVTVSSRLFAWLQRPG